MKPNWTKVLAQRTLRGSAVLLLAIGAVACGGGDDAAPVLAVDAAGVSTVDAGMLQATLSTYALQTLSPAEAASLAFMREEEQLAHDVYAFSAALWPVPVFGNVARSELTHTAAVKTLLDRYQQPDPLSGLPVGTFKSALFQTLYAELTATSRVSLIEALKVGVQIEELDIRDIQAQKTGIDNTDILLVYDNLLKGSRNHLRAFMKVLTAQGGSYTPQYITQAEFDAIINSPNETGN
jgi:hypothetical protein